MDAPTRDTTTTAYRPPLSRSAHPYPQNVPVANIAYAHPLTAAAFTLVSLTEGVLDMQRGYQCSDRVRDRLHEAEDHLKRALTALRVAERQALLG